jgi:tRNA threonylcarbamoyladenosine biosynthesis protein TsaE
VREPVEHETASSEETEALGARLARALPALADFAGIVYLQGDLGSGKTTLARGLLRELGVEGTVRSPTYTLLERYETPAAIVVHLDLYRLQSPAELEPLGLRELHRPQHLWLIEWPERAQGRLPDADVRVMLEAGANRHRIRLDASSAFGRNWLERLRKS